MLQSSPSRLCVGDAVMGNSLPDLSGAKRPQKLPQTGEHFRHQKTNPEFYGGEVKTSTQYHLLKPYNLQSVAIFRGMENSGCVEVFSAKHFWYFRETMPQDSSQLALLTYGGPDALLFPPRKLLIPPRKLAFFGVPAREFGNLIPSTSFARTACSAPRDFGPARAREFSLLPWLWPGLEWLWLAKIPGQAKIIGLGLAWLWPEPWLFIKFIPAREQRGGPEALAFWLGFGLKVGQARPKAPSGQNFDLALALVPKPKSHGFLA
ncbi:hypothetical protein B0H11DRAFT_1909860 [Mycena galericulata]|nr:hypothetical protein B0H11DRAFT_1909860 [Mycena galericulata]